MTCDDEDDALALVDESGEGYIVWAKSNGAIDDAGDEEAISGEGFRRFFDVRAEFGRAGAGGGEGTEAGADEHSLTGTQQRKGEQGLGNTIDHQGSTNCLYLHWRRRLGI